MGSGRWFRAIICLKRTKEDRSKQAKVHSTSEKSNGVKPSNSNALASSSANSRISVEEAAVIRIQNAFRAYMARKRLYRLKGGKRFNLLIHGHTVKNQTSAALSVMHSWCDLQGQIRARRLCMVTEGRLKQKRMENQLKLEAKLHELEVEWCGGSETMEEILARIQQREEAAVKRERAMAYAFSHQWRANATQYLGQTSFNLGKENWGWSWKERWIAARPWEVRVQSETGKPKKNHTKPTSKPEKLTKLAEPKASEMTSAKPALPNGKEATKYRRGVSASFG